MLKLSLVCKGWAEAAIYDKFWRKVDIKNHTMITHFGTMMQFLKNRNSRNINLEYAGFAENFQEYLPAAIESMSSLEEIKLRISDKETLENIFNTNHRMRSLSIIFLKCNSGHYDLQNIFKLICLEELVLRLTVCSIYVENISALKNLQNLTTLELNEFDGQSLGFLSECLKLKCLTMNRICSFVTLDDSAFTLIEKLRVCSVHIPGSWRIFSRMVPNLQNLKQLELVDGKIDGSCFEAIKLCKSLENLLIAERYNSVNHLNLMLSNLSCFQGVKVLALGIEFYLNARVNSDEYKLCTDDVRQKVTKELPYVRVIIYKNIFGVNLDYLISK